jgi:hypothetical protein
MISIATILDKHRALLADKGYTEENLNSFRRQGRFIEKLEENLSVCLFKGIADKKAREFRLPMTGFFNRDNDIALFTFSYQYLPEPPDLILKSMTTKLGRGGQTFIVNGNPDDLPHVTECYHMLANDIQNLLPRVTQPNSAWQKPSESVREFLHDLWTINNDLLQRKGYSSSDYAQQESLEFTMKYKLRTYFLNSAETLKNPLFVLKTNVHFEDLAQTANFRLLFRYHNNELSMRLIGLQAQMGDAKQTHLLSYPDLLPQATQIAHHLSMENTVKMARKIIFDEDLIGLGQKPSPGRKL